MVCIGMYMYVCLIVSVGSRVHEWTRKEDTSVACTDGLKSTQSMSSIFGLSLKNDTDLGNDLNLPFSGQFHCRLHLRTGSLFSRNGRLLMKRTGCICT